MINAVSNTGAVSPVGAATRPSVQETAVRHAAPAPAAPHVAAPASHESTVVTISAQAAHTAQAAQAASTHPTIAQATAKATVDQVKANAQRVAASPNPNSNPNGNPTAAPKPAAEPSAAPVPQIHGVYFSPVPAPLSLDPIPSQHLPEIAFDPADVNQDGQVSTAEQEAYSFHHEPTLAAQPGESAADLTAYTSIARS